MAGEFGGAVYFVGLLLEGMNLKLFPSKVPAGVPQPHSRAYVMRIEVCEDSPDAPPKITPVPTGEAHHPGPGPYIYKGPGPYL